MIELSFEEAGDITLREANFAAYAAWFDAIQRGRSSDASQNLVIDCAVTPGPEALAALFEDFGFLPETLVAELLARVGTPGGGASEGYPVVRLADARKAHTRAAELRTMLAMRATPDGVTVESGTGEALARELAALELTLLPVELLDAAERVTRRALIFRTPAGLLALRPPARDAAAAYVDGIADFQAKKPDSSAIGAGRALMLACAISPDAPALAAAIDQYPALAQWIPPVIQAASSGGKALARP